ncbi:MAG: signal transduction histidine kinase [Alphaproteobacteria bacterium]|jgi:signal transduction histidine kinase
MNLNQPRALTGRVALICGAIIVAAGIALSYGGRQNSSSDLQTMAERNNVALTKAFANAIWPRYAEFLNAAKSLETATLRDHPTTAQLRADTVKQMQGLAVLKVKIYDLGGLTVFSTQATQIGDDKSKNAGFLAAKSGHIVSELSHRDTFSAFEQEIVNRDVLASYIPIVVGTGQDNRVEGVFEVYYDLTELLARVQQSSNRQSLIVFLTLGVLYLLLLTLIFQRDRVVARQHRENLALAAEAAAASEENRMKSEFLANMSHELRPPLNAILGFSDSMRSEIFGPLGVDRYRVYLNDIWDSGQHLLGIVDDVLDMSKIEVGTQELEPVELRLEDVFDHCTRIMAPACDQKAISLATSCPAGGVRFDADERRVNQIMLNVVSNAVKFSPECSTIELSGEITEDGSLVIAVRDHGCGIAEEDIETVFKPFGQVAGTYARSHGGTGLGLPISKSFAELHGGTLKIASVPGEGTKVMILFPPERVKAAAPENTEAAA